MTPAEKHAEQVTLLAKHVEHFRSVGDERRAAQYQAELEQTRDRLVFDQKAEAFVSTLALSEDVTPTTITHSDAVNYVAKVLHEVAQGVKSSHYQRAHRHVDAKLNDGAHVDGSRMTAPWDPAMDVVEHLGLTDATHVTAARSLFQAVGG
jgi:hypothetical protein